MKFTKTLAAITAAAMAVSMAVIPASAVEAEIDSGVKTSTTKLNTDGSVDGTMIQIQTAATGGNVALAATDVVTATAKAVDASADTSEWMVAFNAFDASWGGWAGPASEPGVLEFTATVQEMMDKISCTDIANFGGFIFQVWNTPADVEIEWTLKISPAATTPDDDTTNDDNADDDSTVGDSENVPGDSEEVPGESTETPEKEPAPAAKLELANGGRTVIDSGLVRTNIFNEWTGNDADMIVDKTAFAGANLISVKFTVTGVTEAFDAWIDFADSTWAIQYWGEDADGNAGVTQTPVRIEKDGTYVLTAKLDAVIDAIAYMSIKTNLAAEGEVAPITITIDEIMINEEIEAPTPGDSTPLNPDTGVTLVVVPAALAAAALATSGIVLKKRSK